MNLGQALDFSVAVRLDPDEVLTAECLTAEVQFGDRRVLPSQIQVLIEKVGADAARMRVLTLAIIDEPVVVVQVAAACGNPLSRRYVLLVEPPAFQSGPVPRVAPAAVIALPPDVGAAPQDLPPGAVPGRAADGPSTPVTAAPVVLPANTWRTVGLRRPSAGKTAAGAQRRPSAASVSSLRRRAADTSGNLSGRLRQAAGGGPRLQLDAVAPQVATGGAVEQALQAVAQAAAAARQSASAASAAADRMAALERTVAQLRSDAEASRNQAAQLREQTARSGSTTLIWLLGGLAIALAVLAAWQARRLSAAGRVSAAARLVPDAELRPRPAATETDQRQPTLAMPFVHAGTDTVEAGSPRTRPAPAWPPPAPPDGWEPSRPPDHEPPAARRADVTKAAAATRPAPPLAPPPRPVPAAPKPAERSPESATQITAVQPAIGVQAERAARDVSIDELLDLEQQAEFFVVLGQDEAAIELLVEHLRHTGGGSPLPYLKLLEIHRRRGDRSDYERMRARFNHRFNAYAPDWDIDLLSGRALADYPGVLPRLTQVWPRPLDSMAELEALMFRKAQGELFDLPAYREVLFLYALARDLLDRESADTGNVDLLLPLADGSEFSSTSPTPFLELGRAIAPGPADFEDRPTAPVDLDLSLDTDRPTSIFHVMDEAPTPPRPR